MSKQCIKFGGHWCVGLVKFRQEYNTAISQRNSTADMPVFAYSACVDLIKMLSEAGFKVESVDFSFVVHIKSPEENG